MSEVETVGHAFSFGTFVFFFIGCSNGVFPGDRLATISHFVMCYIIFGYGKLSVKFPFRLTYGQSHNPSVMWGALVV